MVEIRDRESLQAWLAEDGRSWEDCVGIAARSALRAVPGIAVVEPGTLGQIALPVLRAILMSGVARRWPTDEIKESAKSAKSAKSARFAADSARSADSAADFAHSAADSADSAAAANDESAHFAARSADSSAVTAADAARSAAFSTGDSIRSAIAAAESGRAAAFSAVANDAAGLLAGPVGPDLFNRPLWPDGSVPDFFEKPYADLLDFWDAEPATWNFWQRWYAGMLDGAPLDWELQHDVALIPDEIWAEGPEKVAAAIAEIEARHGDAPHTDSLDVDAPEQDELLRVEIRDGQLDIQPNHFNAEEIADRVRTELQQRLKDAAWDLARAAGNYHPWLADRARALETRLELPLDEIDPLSIHFDLGDLLATYEQRDQFTGEDALEAQEILALERIGRYGPGLVRGNEDVERFEALLQLERDRATSEALAAVEDRVVRSIAEATEMAGETLRHYAAAVEGADAGSKKGFARGILSRNTLIAATTFCVGAVASKAVGDSGVAGLVWVWEQSELLRFIAAERGASFLAWFDLVLIEVKQHLAAIKGSLPAIQPLGSPEQEDRKSDED